MRTDLVFKLLIHHDNEGCGAGLSLLPCQACRKPDFGGWDAPQGGRGDRLDTQEDSSNLVVEWAGVRLEMWWSWQGILFSGKARSTHEASCRNKYTFALAGFSLRSWSGSWSVSLRALETGERAHKTPAKNYQSISEVRHFARVVKHFSFPQRPKEKKHKCWVSKYWK